MGVVEDIIRMKSQSSDIIIDDMNLEWIIMFYEVCKIINIYRDLIDCSQKPEISLVPIGRVWAIFSNFSLV